MTGSEKLVEDGDDDDRPRLYLLDVYDDDEYVATCDSCGALAHEDPEAGWFCMNGHALVEDGEDGLYHPIDVLII